MPSPLIDISSQVFLFVASFKRKAARGTPLAAEQLHDEIQQLLRELGQTAQHDPALAQVWEQAKRALVYLVDEVMTTAEWEGRNWWDSHVLEQCVLNNAQKMRGIFFFDELDKAKKQLQAAADGSISRVHSVDLLTVFYCCLKFGFEGKFVGQTQELERQAQEIAALLPASAKSRPGPYFPAAYEHTVEVPPSYHNVMRLASLLAIVVGLAVVFIGFREVLWDELLDQLNDAAVRAGDYFASGAKSAG